MSSNTKKIGVIACTGVVAGNMMSSGIALLPDSSEERFFSLWRYPNEYFRYLEPHGCVL